MKKRILAILLTAAMLLSMLPAGVLAEDEGESQSTTGVTYQVSTDIATGTLEQVITITIGNNVDADIISFEPMDTEDNQQSTASGDLTFVRENYPYSNAWQPGDDATVIIKVVDNSGKKYVYRKKSVQLTTKPYDSTKSREVVYRAYNPALFALLGGTEEYNNSNVNQPSDPGYYFSGTDLTKLGNKIKDDSLGELLTKTEKYNGIADLDKYYCDYYEVDSLSDLTDEQLTELFSCTAEGTYIGKPAVTTTRETNEAVAEAGWRNLYTNVLTVDGVGVLKYTEDSAALNELDKKMDSVVGEDGVTLKVRMDGHKATNCYENHDLYIWLPFQLMRQYDLTYNANYTADGETGAATMAGDSFTSDDSVNIAAADLFTRDGYRFTGWNTDPDGTGTAYSAGATVSLTGDTTLYAQWEENEHIKISPVSITAYVGGESANGSHAPKLRFSVDTSAAGVSLSNLTFYMNTIDEAGKTTQTVMVRDRLDADSEDTLCLFPQLDANMNQGDNDADKFSADDTQVQRGDYLKLVDDDDNSETYAGIYTIEARSGYGTDWYITAKDNNGTVYKVDLDTTDKTVTILEVSEETNGTEVNEMYEAAQDYLAPVGTEWKEDGTGFAAVVSGDTTFQTNGDKSLGVLEFKASEDAGASEETVEISTDDSSTNISLLVDELLENLTENENSTTVLTTKELIDKAETAAADDDLTLDFTFDDAVRYEFKYLDLVNTADGNAVVTASDPVTVYWPYPEGTNADDYEFQVLHYVGMDRTYTVAQEGAAADVFTTADGDDITVEKLDVKTTENGISFETDSFSPFVLMWKEKTYTLTLVYDPLYQWIGVGTPDVEITLPAGTVVDMTALTKTEPNSATETLTIEGHENDTPVSWMRESGDVSTTITGPFTMDEDKTIYAGTTIGGSNTGSGYTLTYVTNGGSAIQSETYSGITTVDLTKKTTTREGYTFAGWYTNSALVGTPITSITLTSNRTVYAKWTEATDTNKVKLTLVYDPLWQYIGGDKPDVVIELDVGTTVDMSTLSIPGHEGEAAVTWLAESGNPNTVITEPFTMNADKTIYAWENISGGSGLDSSDTFAFHLSYQSNGGSYIKSRGFTEATYVDFDDPNYMPTRSGYKFTGWYRESDLKERLTGEVLIAEETTVWAGWEEFAEDDGIVKYTLHYESNGGTEYPDETYAADTKVTLDKTPIRAGYQFKGWYADQELTTLITDVEMTGNKTVYGAWNASTVPELLNGDNHYAYIIGDTNGDARPEDSITRAEIAAIFFRLLKDDVRDGNLTKENPFTDVPENAWYCSAVSTLTKLGIITGRTTTTFAPNAPITRAELATICARFDTGVTSGANIFSDISGHWAEEYIQRAAALGWILGYTDGTFRPNDEISRAETMTMINRVLCRIPESTDDLLENMKEWPDNANTSKWYYLAVQEATNSHDCKKKGEIYETWTQLTEIPDWTRYQ